MLITYVALWALTALAAIIVAAIPDLALATRRALTEPTSFHRHPADIAFLGQIAATNAAICAVPLIVMSLRLHAVFVGRVACVFVTAWLGANVALVGASVGAFGPHMMRWLPHLPLEWAALALAWGAFYHHHDRAPHRGVCARYVPLITVALIAAAALETYATPHT